jgi:serine/threonine-protein kinase
MIKSDNHYAGGEHLMKADQYGQYGPYICRSLIEADSQGGAFIAEHETTGKKVLLRVMTVTIADVKQALNQCHDLLADLAAIDAPNIIAIEDYGSEDHTLYIALSLVQGGTLAQRMAHRRIGIANVSDDHQPVLPSTQEVLALTQRMAHALDGLHATGLVHGQLEPRTILFDRDGQAYLSEIGFTRLMKIMFRLDATNSFNMSRYSPPELWNGERPSPATDQYALACILYELLTGQAAFAGVSIYDLMKAHTEDVAVPPHYVRPELPESLAMIFWQALAKSPGKRFRTVTGFYQALYKALGDDEPSTTDFFTFSLS